MRRIESVLALCAGALVISGTLISVQQSAGFQPLFAAGQKASPAKRAKTEKPKKWKGKLVDANCVVKALNTVSVHDLSSASQGVPHFANGPSPQGQSLVGGAQSSTTVTCPGLGCLTPGSKSGPYVNRNWPGGDNRPATENSGMRPDVAARMQRAALVKDAIKRCAASKSTSEFGLALSSGRMIEFDQDGNSEASQAIKVAELRPGKPAKATVKGIEESNGSVHVTSVQIKGKRKK